MHYNQEASLYNQEASLYNQDPLNHDQEAMHYNQENQHYNQDGVYTDQESIYAKQEPASESETVLLKLPMFSEQMGPEAAAIYSHPDDNYYDYDYGSESAASWYQYQDNYHAQVGAEAIIQGPPADCLHGVLDISGKEELYIIM